MNTLEELWPLFGLRILTPRLELTPIRDEQGLGKEMRAAVLMFAFDHLGARTALSEAADWNAASLGVSRRLGYSGNGVSDAESRPGLITRQQHVRLDAADFVRPDFGLAVHGFDRAMGSLLPA